MDKNLNYIAISAIIATSDRSVVFNNTLISLLAQSVIPQQIIVVDASQNDETYIVCKQYYPTVEWIRASKKGAAAQRSQGLQFVETDFILFFDDDVLFHNGCIEILWKGINSASDIGGISAMIINQQYHTPRRITRFMYLLMHGENLKSYAGMCIGPAWNLLPEDKDYLPAMQPVEWLNTTCTIYKKIALPEIAFPEHFRGYSLLEDLCLSLEVAKRWKLLNARNAKIFHDSQPGAHKENSFEVSKMELVNRYYVMTKLLGRTGFKNNFKFFIFQLFGILSSSDKYKTKVWLGKLDAIITIAKGIHAK